MSLKHLQAEQFRWLALGRRGVGALGEGAGRQRTVNSDVSLLFGYSCSCILMLTSFPTLLWARA